MRIPVPSMRRAVRLAAASLLALLGAAAPSAAPLAAAQPTGVPPAAAAPTVAAAAVPATCTVPSGTFTTFSSAGLSRTFMIQLPPGVSGPTTPMVISLHGGLGSAALQQQVTSFEAASDQPPADAAATMAAATELPSLGRQMGFIAVFPQAQGSPPNTVWNAAPTSPDVTFIADLTTYLHTRGCSSPKVTSINGFSLGAMLASRLLCARPDLYSGGAMVAGLIPPTPGCRLPASMEILMVHGVLDTSVPFNGSLVASLAELAGPDSVSSVDRVAITKQWAAVKDCPSPGWSTTGSNTLTDFGCPTSATWAVVATTRPHAWDHPGVNTSELVWSVMRPDRQCTPTTAGPSDPAIAAAIEARLASDIAFRVDFVRNMSVQLTCNPALRQTVVDAINAEIKAHPGGQVTQQLAFAIRELARTHG